jgi:gamma-glutamylputrescine oxidase
MPPDNGSRHDPEGVGPDRRRFLKKAALAGAGVLGGAVAVNALAPLALPEERVFEPNTSYWARALPPATAPLAADIDADVVVIGGGFTGLSSAYYLSKTLPGKRIVLLEASICGNGASGRNGAMVLTMTESTQMRLSDAPAIDRRLYELTAENIHTLQNLAIEHGIDCELERNGALQTFDSSGQVADAAAFCARARDLGLPFEFWSREQTTATIGTHAYEGALFDPGGGQVHPGKLVALWKTAATRAGVEIYDHTPVVDIAENVIHEITTTDGHRVRAPALVLATNVYTSRLGYLRRAVAPVFDYVAITPALSEAQLEAAGWRSLIPFNDSRTEVYYAGLTRDRRIHFGGGPVDYSFNNGVRLRSDSAARYSGLHREFTRLFPALAGVGFESTWAGSVDMSLDGSPSVGTLGRHRNIFYGVGFSGHGINLTSVIGRVIADLVADRGAQWAWLPFLNRLPPYIPNEPFRWLGIQADLAYTRFTEA